jgi:hypothetical protein
MALLIVVQLPGASSRPSPCNPLGVNNPDPALPTCGIDYFNAEAVLIFLLVMLWFGGLVIVGVAFTISRLVNWLRRPRGSSSE